MDFDAGGVTDTIRSIIKQIETTGSERSIAAYDALINIIELSRKPYAQMSDTTKSAGKKAMLNLINALLNTSMTETELEQTFDISDPSKGSWKLLMTKMLIHLCSWVWRILSLVTDKHEIVTRTLQTWNPKFQGILDKLRLEGGIVCAGLCIAAIAIVIIVIVCVIGIIIVFATAVIGLVTNKLLDVLFAAWNTYQNASKHKLAISKMDGEILAKQGMELAKQDSSSEAVIQLMQDSSHRTAGSITDLGETATSGITSVGVAGVSAVGVAASAASTAASTAASVAEEVLATQTGGSIIDTLSQRLNPMQMYTVMKEFVEVSDLYKEIGGFIQHNIVNLYQYNDKHEFVRNETAFKNVSSAIETWFSPAGVNAIINNSKKDGKIHGGLQPFVNIISTYPIMVEYAKICKNKQEVCDFSQVFPTICENLNIEC